MEKNLPVRRNIIKQVLNKFVKTLNYLELALFHKENSADLIQYFTFRPA